MSFLLIRARTRYRADDAAGKTPPPPSRPGKSANLEHREGRSVVRKRQSNPEVALISWVVCQAEGVSWSSWVAGKLASRGRT